MIRAQPTPTGDWVDLVKSAHPTGWQAEMRMISRVGLPSTFVTAYLDGVAVGTGRGVADSGATGVFHMATIPRAQGNAVAQTVLAAISEWASSVGAGRLYLQVDPTNVAASRLYVRAGFELLTDYAYRITAEDQSVPVPAVADDR